ncbi:MAG: gamma-glutamyltransferase [bacterium]
MTERETAQGANGVVVAGHPLATEAGLEILRRGGNAVDAGVAAGIALNAAHHDMTSFSGVAPILIHLAGTGESRSFDGLGRWPRAASLEWFWENQDGRYEPNLRHCVLPGAASSWISALRRFGTLSFAEVAEAAIRVCEEGVEIAPFQAGIFARNEESLLRWPGSRAVVGAPGGGLLQAGDIMRQPDHAETLRRLAAAEKSAGGSREDKIEAAHAAFYEGEAAEKMVRFSDEHGGFFTREDFAEFRAAEEPPIRVAFEGHELVGCGPWCQGPVLLEAVSILKNFDLRALGHNSPAYLHLITCALLLAYADREAHVGDPGFVDVPIEEMLSEEYTRARAGLIETGRAFEGMPPPGDPVSGKPLLEGYEMPRPGNWETNRGLERGAAVQWTADTSYVGVVDGQGNMFSATPSDTLGSHLEPPLIPGLGLALSGRGRQSRLDPRHPAAIAPGKRPRLTPNPALVLKDGAPAFVFGTPGGDVQPQAMLQVFLNLLVFGMEPQAAVEAPRLASYSFPNSFYPHDYFPGLLCIESRVGEKTLAALEAMGHKVEAWPESIPKAGSVLVAGLRKGGLWRGAADHRRLATARAL